MSGTENQTVDGFARAWLKSGMKPPVAASTSPRRPVCQIAGCGLLSFVVLRMADYAEALCLKHFDEVQELVAAMTRSL
jgi:hypothetical protein